MASSSQEGKNQTGSDSANVGKRKESERMEAPNCCFRMWLSRSLPGCRSRRMLHCKRSASETGIPITVASQVRAESRLPTPESFNKHGVLEMTSQGGDVVVLMELFFSTDGAFHQSFLGLGVWSVDFGQG